MGLRDWQDSAMAPPASPVSEEAEAPGRVLFVDDQPELRRLFRRNLTRAGHTVVEASNGSVALNLVQQLSFDVVVSDVRMPDMSGIELLHALIQLEPDLPVVLTSGSPDAIAPLAAQELGAQAYLVKPVSFEEMRVAVTQAIELRRARAAARDSMDPPYRSVERLKVPRIAGEDDDDTSQIA
jgi:DNA-binding NtrC family response regulator